MQTYNTPTSEAAKFFAAMETLAQLLESAVAEAPAFTITREDADNFREVRLSDGGQAAIHGVYGEVVLLTRDGDIWPVKLDGTALDADNENAIGFVDDETDTDEEDEKPAAGWVNVYQRPDGTCKIGKPLDSEHRANRMRIRGLTKIATYQVR